MFTVMIGHHEYECDASGKMLSYVPVGEINPYTEEFVRYKVEEPAPVEVEESPSTSITVPFVIESSPTEPLSSTIS